MWKDANGGVPLCDLYVTLCCAYLRSQLVEYVEEKLGGVVIYEASVAPPSGQSLLASENVARADHGVIGWRVKKGTNTTRMRMYLRRCAMKIQSEEMAVVLSNERHSLAVSRKIRSRRQAIEAVLFAGTFDDFVWRGETESPYPRGTTPLSQEDVDKVRTGLVTRLCSADDAAWNLYFADYARFLRNMQ